MKKGMDEEVGKMKLIESYRVVQKGFCTVDLTEVRKTRRKISNLIPLGKNYITMISPHPR